VLRLVRRASVSDSTGADAGFWVVSWSLRLLTSEEAEQLGLSRASAHQAWVRTQSLASVERPTLQQFWAAALQEGSPTSVLPTASGLGSSASSVNQPATQPAIGTSSVSTAVLFPVQQWQLFYYRGDAWSNPLSSSGAVGASQDVAIPDGVRLILTLPESGSPGGRITLDWVRPNFTTLRS
jgi:hypothetical protein